MPSRKAVEIAWEPAERFVGVMGTQLFSAKYDQLALRGRQVKVRVLAAENFTIAITGVLLRVASIKDEPWQTECVSDPARILDKLKTAPSRPDIFTFAQRLPNIERRFDYPVEYDNVAAIPVSTYDDWWKHQIKPSARNKARKAEKSGIVTRAVPFDENLVRGISAIYNESAVRQGKTFWHYGKDIETVRSENSTYVERSEFLGAFLGDRLVGFLKMVYVGTYAEVMQILSLLSERNSAPTNSLIAKAVECCASKGLTHFVYANFAYGKKDEDSLTEFKKSNGFVRIDVPRYYIPLTWKGRVALALGLHRGVGNLLPRPVLLALIALRAKLQTIRWAA